MLCQRCGIPIDTNQAQAEPDIKLAFIVTLNVRHYCGKRRATARDAIARRNARAIKAFKKDVAVLLQLLGRPADDLTVDSEQDYIATVMLRCSQQVADLLKAHPGVKAVSVNGVAFALPS
jgi:hypothetical protein